MKKLIKKIAKHITKETGIPMDRIKGGYSWNITLTPGADTQYVAVVGEDVNYAGLVYFEVLPVNDGTEEMADKIARENIMPLVEKHAPYSAGCTVH